MNKFIKKNSSLNKPKHRTVIPAQAGISTLILVFLLQCISNPLHAQKEDYNWIFGELDNSRIIFIFDSEVLTIDTLVSDRTRTGIRVSGTVNGLAVRGNTIGNHRTGLRYMSVLNNGVNPIEQLDAGNMWVGTTYGSIANQEGGAFNNSNSIFDIDAQRYEVNSNINVNFEPPSHYPDGPSPLFPNTPEWFPQSTSSTFFDCANTSFYKPPSPPNVELLNKTARGELELPKYEAELNKQEQRVLYENMKENASMHNMSSVLDSFYNAINNTELKDMYDAKTLSKAIKKQAATEKAIVSSLYDNAHAVIDSIVYVDSIYNYSISNVIIDTNTIDQLINTNYINNRTVLLTELENLKIVEQPYRETIKQAEELKADESLGKYSSIVNTEIIDYNNRYTNELRMQLAYKNYVLNQLDIDALFLIADQCPLAGGQGVFAARSLIMNKIDTFWIDYDRCMEEGFDIRKTDGEDYEIVIPEQTGISIFPNPAKEELSIQLNKDYKQIKVVINNMVGQSVYENEFQVEGNIIQLSLKNINLGVYTISIYNENKKVYYEKLIIE